MEDELYTGLWLFAKKVAHAVKKAVPCKRIALTVIGLEVAHAHVHLIPINGMNDCNFANEKLKLSKDEFEEMAKKIAVAF